MDALFLFSIVAFSGWVSITMLIHQFKMVQYHYNIKSLGGVFHLCLLIISPLIFFGLIILGMFLIYSYDVMTTGQF